MREERMFCVLRLVAAIVILMLYASTSFGAAIPSDPYDSGPSLGTWFNFGDGFTPQWSTHDWGKSTSVDFSAEFQHPMLKNANWTFSVQKDDKSLWSAQLWMSGPLNDLDVILGQPKSHDSYIQRGQVTISEHLSLSYWRDDWNEVNNMQLSASLSLSPATITSSDFRYQELCSWYYDGDKMVQKTTPDNWFGMLNINGRFLDTPTTAAETVGASFSTSSVPEPSIFVMMTVGLVPIVGWRAWRRYNRGS